MDFTTLILQSRSNSMECSLARFQYCFVLLINFFTQCHATPQASSALVRVLYTQ